MISMIYHLLQIKYYETYDAKQQALPLDTC